MMSEPRIRARRYHWFEHARRRLDLVSFSDLADWLARVPGRLGRDEERRIEALAELRNAALSGAFGPIEKLSIAYMPNPVYGTHAGQFALRWTAWQLKELTVWSIEFAADLWVPRALAERWFVARGFTWAPWFAGGQQQIVAPKISRKSRPDQEQLNRALLELAMQRRQKIKQSDDEAVAKLQSLGATSRMIKEAFRSLPPEYRYSRGKPAKGE